MVERIRNTHKDEEMSRRIREKAQNAGLLGRMGEQSLANERSENLIQENVYVGQQEQGVNESELRETVIVSEENGLGIDLNVEVMEGVGDGVEGLERVVYAHCEEDIQDEHVQHARSDAFNLGPLIE